MLELKVISNDRTERRHRFSKRTVSIGRNPDSDIALPVPGVWERHAEIAPAAGGRFEIRASGEGSVVVQNETVTQKILRAGDRICIGSVVLEFQIASPRQRTLVGMEAALWLLIGLGAVTQAALIFILIR